MKIVCFRGRSPWQWRVVWPKRHSLGGMVAGIYAGSFAGCLRWGLK
jgi:hypothetical protein